MAGATKKMSKEYKEIASHDGIVTAVAPNRVTVTIQSVSACASCAAHAKCGFADSKEKTMEVATNDWKDYAVGDNVTVNIDQSRGMLAVWIAYLLPALLIIAVAVTLSLLHLPEPVVVLATFATLGLYILALYLIRRRLESKFEISIHKC